MIFRFLSAVSSGDEARLAAVDARLAAFYASADAQQYWDIAEGHNADWRDGAHPQHEKLLAMIEPGESVADFGCGSAHAAAALGHPGRYTGIDGSESALRDDRLRYPEATFIRSSLYTTPLRDRQVDWAISLFVLEHAVYPTRLLDEMLRVIRPGGRLAIICPQMRPRMMTSMWAGLTAAPFAEKRARRLWIDALWHAVELKLLFPLFRWWSDHFRGRFLIYPEPRCLYAAYASDTDAVYWADEAEVRAYLASRGCAIESPPSPPGHGLVFVVARKGAA